MPLAGAQPRCSTQTENALACAAMPSRKLKVGLVQMSTTEDRASNVKKALDRRARRGRAGAPAWCAFRSCSRGPTSVRSRTRPCSTSRSRSLGRPPRRWPRWRKSSVSWSWPACSRSARRACTTTPRWCSAPAARSSGRYRKMHIPDDPLFYEKFYFTPGDLGFVCVDTPFAKRRPAGVLGSVVPGRRAPDGAARRGDPALSDGHRLAPEREGRATARRSSRRGRRSSAPTPSPTACSW